MIHEEPVEDVDWIKAMGDPVAWVLDWSNYFGSAIDFASSIGDDDWARMTDDQKDALAAAIEDEMVEGQSVEKAVPCRICGRPLTDKKSIARGFGPGHLRQGNFGKVLTKLAMDSFEDRVAKLRQEYGDWTWDDSKGWNQALIANAMTFSFGNGWGASFHDFRYDDERLIFNTLIYNDRGEIAGQINGFLDPDDGVSVSLDWVQVNERSAVGHGMLSALMGSMIEHFTAGRVSKVYLQAGLDVGGYAWAKAGFRFNGSYNHSNFIDSATKNLRDLSEEIAVLHNPSASPESRQSAVRWLQFFFRTTADEEDLYDMIEDMGGQDRIQQMYDWLESRRADTELPKNRWLMPLQVAAYGREDRQDVPFRPRNHSDTAPEGSYGTTWLGKALMLNTGWSAVLDLEPWIRGASRGR